MYPRWAPRERAYVNMLEQEVSVQLSDRSPLSITWNQRPVAGSWYFSRPAANLRKTERSWGRRDWFAGMASRTPTIAMEYQPTARHQCSGASPVCGSAQLALFDSS